MSAVRESAVREPISADRRIQPAARALTIGLGVLMAAQALTGRAWPGQYRDPDWIRATWIGNDWLTLAVAVPLLLGALSGAGRGSPRALLLWLGVLGYALYNYAFYVFGAALNAFFLFYVAGVALAGIALILALRDLDVAALSCRFQAHTPVRLIGGALVLVGASLATVWIGMWAAFVFAGRATPVEPEAFKVVAALDLVLMVPALVAGGLLLWRRQPWGYVIAAAASIQGALYLLVLTVNALMAVRLGLVAAPGEVPIWGALALFTAAVALALLGYAGPGRVSPACRDAPAARCGTAPSPSRRNAPS